MRIAFCRGVDLGTTKRFSPFSRETTGDESVYEAVDRWLPEPFTEYLTSVNGFGGRYRFEGTFVQLCWECLQYVYTLAWNIAFIFTILVQYHEWNLKRKQRSTPSLNFDDTSKFWGEKCIGSSRFNIYRFFFASHLQMTHELSLKVYKVKACLLHLKCGVSSKYIKNPSFVFFGSHFVPVFVRNR